VSNLLQSTSSCNRTVLLLDGNIVNRLRDYCARVVLLTSGLIGTYWGGTADELWSSPDALKECLDPTKPVPATDSSLFYGMLSPFLRTTIKGAIW
jgi:hypothetical protein